MPHPAAAQRSSAGSSLFLFFFLPKKKKKSAIKRIQKWQGDGRPRIPPSSPEPAGATGRSGGRRLPRRPRSPPPGPAAPGPARTNFRGARRRAAAAPSRRAARPWRGRGGAGAGRRGGGGASAGAAAGAALPSLLRLLCSAAGPGVQPPPRAARVRRRGRHGAGPPLRSSPLFLPTPSPNLALPEQKAAAQRTPRPRSSLAASAGLPRRCQLRRRAGGGRRAGGAGAAGGAATWAGRGGRPPPPSLFPCLLSFIPPSPGAAAPPKAPLRHPLLGPGGVSAAARGGPSPPRRSSSSGGRRRQRANPPTKNSNALLGGGSPAPRPLLSAEGARSVRVPAQPSGFRTAPAGLSEGPPDSRARASFAAIPGNKEPHRRWLQPCCHRHSAPTPARTSTGAVPHPSPRVPPRVWVSKPGPRASAPAQPGRGVGGGEQQRESLLRSDAERSHRLGEKTGELGAAPAHLQATAPQAARSNALS